MREEEAEVIAVMLDRLAAADISPMLNIGSSTGRYRSHSQPHIDRRVFGPLESRGVRVLHIDRKADDGVDLVGDVLDPEFARKLSAMAPQAILCCNILQHVADTGRFAQVVEDIAVKDTFILVTAPSSYPYTSDPFDNGFRPAPEDIARLFPRSTKIAAHIVVSTGFWRDLKSMQGGARRRFLLKSAARLWSPFYKFEAWKNRFHRYLWLFRPYRISVVLLRKTDA